MLRLTVIVVLLILVSMATASELDKYLKLEWSEEVKCWEPSEELKNDLPAYLSGFSYEGSPVYFLEYGRWKISNYVKSTAEKKEDFYKRVKRLFRGLVLDVAELDEPETGVIIVLDTKGLSIKMLTSPPVLQAHVTLMRYLDQVSPLIERICLVNASYTTETWISAVRTVAGSVMGKAEVVKGGKPEIAAFLSTFMSKTNFSSDYGGSSERPARIY